MKTNYLVGGKDLATIFKLRKADDPQIPATGYKVDGKDLAEIFAPYTGGKKAKPIGYQAKGRDLSDIFEPLPGAID